jgi:hypothetical protein
MKSRSKRNKELNYFNNTCVGPSCAFVPSTERRVLWKKNSLFVCLSSGQRWKVKKTKFRKILFRIHNQVHSTRWVSQSGIGTPHLSTNQISSSPKVCQSDPFMVWISSNEIFMIWEFSQLSLSMVVSRRIRFFCAAEPANQVFYGRRAAQSSFLQAIFCWTIFCEDLATNQSDSCERGVALILQEVKLYFLVRFREENPMGQDIHPIPSHFMGYFTKLSYLIGWDGLVPSHPKPWLKSII